MVPASSRAGGSGAAGRLALRPSFFQFNTAAPAPHSAFRT